MSSSYYYLVTSLPPLRLDEYKEPHRVSEFVADLEGNVSLRHYGWVREILGSYDNANIVDLLCADGVGGSRLNGNWEYEELKRILESQLSFFEQLPDGYYLKEFFDRYKQMKKESGGFPRRDLEDLIWGIYYERMCSHENSFVRTYFRFDAGLRNVLTALNIRRSQMEKSGYITTEEDMVVERLKTSSAADFGLSGELPYIGALNEAFGRTDLVQVEKFIDQLRWQEIERINTFSYFEVDTLLGYLIKLMLVERWLRLDQEKGKENFLKLVDIEKESVYQ